MEILFCNEPIPDSVTQTIFLAGPSPRKSGEVNWRKNALEHLSMAGYQGTVFVPMTRRQLYGEVFDEQIDYAKQCEWERRAMNMADVILFYVYRMNKNEGLTTNVEFGKYLKSGRIVYARPEGAVSVRYLDEQANHEGVKIHNTLISAVSSALKLIGPPALREGVEVYIPNIVWQSAAWKTWYSNFLKAGNKLTDFTVEALFGGIEKGSIFGFVGNPTVEITMEQRSKNDECIFARSPLGIIGLYHQDEAGKRSYVLVREFRAAVSNDEGYVYEFPSGSDKDDTDPLTNAAKELREETGLFVEDLNRFQNLGHKQTFATFMSTPVNVFVLRLTDEELEECKTRVVTNETLGECAEERIKLFIINDAEAYNEYPLDLTTLGVINLIKGIK